MHEKRWLALFAAGLLAACGSPAPERPPTTGELPEDACGAGRVQAFEGQVMDDELRERIAAESGAATVRVMRPGEAHTMDYRADRLGVRLDADDRIVSLTCG